MLARVDALTSIRFIAALVVFVHHWLYLGGYAYWGDHFGVVWDNHVTMWGWELRYGVTLFFVLSGFLLAARYFDTIFTKVSFAEYWVKRFARIMPLYWSLVTILLVIHLVQGSGSGLKTENFLIYYSLTQSFFSDLMFTGLGTAWSLTVEECFYISLPFIILAVRLPWKRLANQYARYAVMAAVLVGFWIFFYQLGRFIHNEELTKYGGFMRNEVDIRLYTIFGRFFDFGIGIAFGILYLKSKNFLQDMKWVPDIAVVIATVCIGVVLFQIANNDRLESDIGYQLNHVNAFLSAVVIYFLCSGRSVIAKAMAWRPLVYLGEVSFALYLIHANSVIDPFYHWVRDLNLPLVVSFSFLYVFCTILSVIAYELIERPAQYFILSKYYKRDDFRRPTVVRAIFGKGPKRKKATHVLVPQPTGLGGAPLEPMPIDEAIATGAPRAGHKEKDEESR